MGYKMSNDHTSEYYENQIAKLKEQLDSWRELARYEVAHNGLDGNIELLKADRDKWRKIADDLALATDEEERHAALRAYSRGVENG